MNNVNFDLAVIGAGHAGTEAAGIAAQLGLNVLLFTIPNVEIASTPCNPSIGGVGKAQVVRELDCLGGLMGIIADRSAIQYRTLNESKGAAVHSTRVQVDKSEYTKIATNLLHSMANIKIIKSMVKNVCREGDSFQVKTESDDIFTVGKVVVTAGTFLNGKLHTGQEMSAGGRIGLPKSPSLTSIFTQVRCHEQRFKTGTPPRLSKLTIDFSKMQEQESDPNTRNFHLLHPPERRFLPQVSCFLTKTNSDTLRIIRENKSRSPMFNGQISGVGPRYCPSIEDKAYRYLEKDVHHVFIEPEGLELETIYPNGVSTSLPKDVQKAFIQTISGLENAEILVFGHAVEYDVVDTTQLDHTLQCEKVAGLYFAGQVNGTSGYEEAAAQGFMAGVNAALSILGKEKLILDRNDSYIGVLIDDLVSSKRDEPYRLFTARAENRLYMREDNVFLRMARYRKKLGLNLQIDKHITRLCQEFEILSEVSDKIFFLPNNETKMAFTQNGYGNIEVKTSLADLMRRPGPDNVKILIDEFEKVGIQVDPWMARSVYFTKKYQGYIEKAIEESRRFERILQKRIKWEELAENTNVSFECRLRIKKYRPQTFSQLQKLEGIRPATLAYVAGVIL